MHWTFYHQRPRRVRDLSCGDKQVYPAYSLRRVLCRQFGTVKTECLEWLADNPFYTKRFAFFVGRRCRETPIKDVAEELFLDSQTVKDLDKQYMQEQLRRAGDPSSWINGFFDQWRAVLRWQRLEPFDRFADLVAAHWDSIEAYCHDENKVPLGFVEGLNNKIRAIQRRAYGYRDEQYFRLKSLTCTLRKL